MKKRYGILLVLSFSIAIVSSCVKEKNANIEVIEKSVKGNPDCEKEYVFSVSSEEKEEIEEKFYEKISEELMIDAIRKVEYREEWGVE